MQNWKPFLCTAVMLSTFAGCKDHTTPPLALPSVRVIASHLSESDTGVRYSVSLLPCRQSDLSFKSGGIVEQIRQERGSDGRMRAITMGDSVGSGTELARVRTSDYRDKVDQAQAQLRQAEGQLAAALAGQQLAERNYARANALYTEASLTKQDFDRATQQRDQSTAAVTQAQAGIANAKAQIAEANQALHDAAIVSPYAGVIVDRHIELGNLVGSNSPAFTVADISCVKANFSVPENALSQVRRGRSFDLSFVSIQQSVRGIVTAVSPSADQQSRVFTAELTAPNPARILKPGMIGSLSLSPQHVEAAHVLVPLNALVKGSNGGFAVYVLQRNSDAPKVHLRAVTVGSSVGTDVQVLSGLTTGELVVSVGAQTLQDNSSVRVLE